MAELKARPLTPAAKIGETLKVVPKPVPPRASAPSPDKLSMAGIVVAFVAVLGGQILEGGHIGSLLQATAFVIVIGGTVGAVMLQTTLPVFLRGMRMARWVFMPPSVDCAALMAQLLEWSQAARRGGLLALEPVIAGARSPLERKGLQLVVDGVEPDVLRAALELDLDAFDERHRQGAKVWEAAGGYAPTVGILGAVLGLIHVMENLSDPSKLGAGIAVAFVATVYGVGCANLVFLPIANKLKFLVAEQVRYREMLIEGLAAIASGDSPRAVESRLGGYLE